MVISFSLFQRKRRALYHRLNREEKRKKNIDQKTNMGREDEEKNCMPPKIVAKKRCSEMENKDEDDFFPISLPFR